ncbi:hypothetical protein L1987_21511 [Smallanthus sonchifolius]|uniref:Uncharacterized protein n=1 Tax=Smallanthus sonchifolius TaxID=185202 RepID=A0ACB9IW85_9ASTR|nr:hypothetical protein L1987_21511 [Smallanthus sonchifolius]
MYSISWFLSTLATCPLLWFHLLANDPTHAVVDCLLRGSSQVHERRLLVLLLVKTGCEDGRRCLAREKSYPADHEDWHPVMFSYDVNMF